jgi:hypothetical protein
MMTLDQIREALQDRNARRVAVGAGLLYKTVLKIRNDPDANPTYKTVLALDKYFTDRKINQ